MAAKKTFIGQIENPAELFISTPQEPETRPAAPAKAPEGYKVNPLYLETKSKRLQLLVQPSLLEKLRARAKAEGRSVNDLVHTILEDALGKE